MLEIFGDLNCISLEPSLPIERTVSFCLTEKEPLVTGISLGKVSPNPYLSYIFSILSSVNSTGLRSATANSFGNFRFGAREAILVALLYHRHHHQLEGT